MKKFIIKDYYENNLLVLNNEEITMKVDPHLNLNDILESFERFLKACGYVFDGHLEINDLINEENEFDELNEYDEETE